MTHQQVEEFFKDNFGKEYHPVLHGRCESISPLALIVKQRRKWYHRRANLVAVANLEKYVIQGKRDDLRKLTRERLKTIRDKLGKDEVDRLEERASSQEFKLEVENVAGATYRTVDCPGDLVLGKLDEEYFEDPDIREILSNFKLDEEKMKPFEDAQKIYLVTSVVYSDKFKIKGKPERSDSVNFHGDIGKFTKLLLPKEISADISVQRKRKIYATPRIVRKGRGPLLFAYSRVSYSKSNSRLSLFDFVGKNLILPRGQLAHKKEHYETVTDEELKEIEEIICIEDLETKLENAHRFLRTCAEDERKELLQTCLRYFEDVLDRNQKLIVIEVPPTSEQSLLLQTFGFKVTDILLKASENSEETRRAYGAIFKYLEGLSDEKWTAFIEGEDRYDSEDGPRKKTKADDV